MNETGPKISEQFGYEGMRLGTADERETFPHDDRRVNAEPIDAAIERRLSNSRQFSDWFNVKINDRLKRLQAAERGLEEGQPGYQAFIDSKESGLQWEDLNVDFTPEEEGEIRAARQADKEDGKSGADSSAAALIDQITARHTREKYAKLIKNKGDFVTEFKYKIEKGDTVKFTGQDLDSRVGKFIIEKAGLTGIAEKGVLTPVKAGQTHGDGLHFDTGGKYGVHFDTETGALIVDHHGPGAKADTSSSELLFDMFDMLGWIPEQDEDGEPLRGPLLQMVEYITQEDNKTEQAELDNFFEGHKTPAMLCRNMKPENILRVFRYLYEHDLDVYDVLTDDELKAITVKFGDASGKQTETNLFEQSEDYRVERLEPSIAVVKELEALGFAVDSPKFGRILIDPVDMKFGKHQVSLGGTAAAGMGYKTYLKYDAKTQTFFCTSETNIFDKESDVPAGTIMVRGRMWMIPISQQGKAKMPLYKVLKHLGVDLFSLDTKKHAHLLHYTGSDKHDLPMSLFKARDARSVERKKKRSNGNGENGQNGK